MTHFACSSPLGNSTHNIERTTQVTDATLFRFVFLGDTRGDYKSDPPCYLAEETLRKIVRKILDLVPRPDFVIFNGDMVAKTAYRKAPGAIKRWQSVFLNPMKSNRILVYTTPGNHVIDGNATNPDNSMRYIPLFNKYFQADNPMNGPKGYKGVSYSFTYKNCHFVTVTSFMTHKGYDNRELSSREFIQKKKDFEYFINKKNRRWLKEDLKRDHSDFTLFFTHCPIYPVGPHYKDKLSFHAHPANSSIIARTLIDDGVHAFLASHEHLYARANLGPSNPDSSGLKGELLQVIIGSAGAPLSSKPARKDMVFEKYEKTYNYLVADVRSNMIKCVVYDDNDGEIDSFSIIP
ncbi:MAG: metallophosphoesterase [Thermodesulfobacteriota bacterium]|nr:metallophosphoesterase [Thermodesulfobacteriota bacterium]